MRKTTPILINLEPFLTPPGSVLLEYGSVFAKGDIPRKDSIIPDWGGFKFIWIFGGFS